MAPNVLAGAAILTIAVHPVRTRRHVMGRRIALQIADLNVGILYLFAVSGMTVYGVVPRGWASGSKYPLLGGCGRRPRCCRTEVSMGLSLIGTSWCSSRSDVQIVRPGGLSSASCRSGRPRPAARFVSSRGAVRRGEPTPFDLPEGESELVAVPHGVRLLQVSSSDGGITYMVVGAAGRGDPLLRRWQSRTSRRRVPIPRRLRRGRSAAAVLLLRIGRSSRRPFLSVAYVWSGGRFPFRYDQVMRLGGR